MILEYKIGDHEITLQPDLAGEFPIYAFHKLGDTAVLYSKSIRELLGDARVKKPLAISNEGISFLLQSGVVPPPKTIYKNIFVITVGHTLQVKTYNNCIQLIFKNEFPFQNHCRPQKDENPINENKILEMLAQATVMRIDKSRPTYLFHSAGKDSNMIALALAEAGLQKDITFVSHRSKGDADESKISKFIAKKLGFNHVTLEEKFNFESSQFIDQYFQVATIPVVDNVALAYPIYTQQLPDLVNSNIIDGGGNDVYMCTPPTMREIVGFRASFFFSHFRTVAQSLFGSETIWNVLTRSRIEWCGFGGFMFADAQKIFNKSIDVRPLLLAQQRSIRDWDDFDFKTNVLTTIVAAEKHIRKFRTAADFWNANAILPFANESVANYFMSFPEKYLFDRKRFKNKIILRKMLKERIDLDCDMVGKMGYSFDYTVVIEGLGMSITTEILSCKLWDQPNISAILKKLQKKSLGSSLFASRAKLLIQRLYMISAWCNRNQYVS